MDNDLSFIYSVLLNQRDMAQKFLCHIQNADDTDMYRKGSEDFLKGQIKAYEMALNIIQNSIVINTKSRNGVCCYEEEW